MIFISYAKEDYAFACAMYVAFRAENLQPWMDKPPAPFQANGLRIGQRWRSVLEEKLRSADQIVLILSPRSVRKRGFVQREFRTALGLMNDLPDDQVFVLPVLAEKCDVPSLRAGEIDLLDLQWEEVGEQELPAFATQIAKYIREEQR
jgi:hypothetical protein